MLGVASGQPLIPLYQWFSPSRGDNFVTSDHRWAGKKGDIKSPDYQFVRIEGMIYDPALPQPPATFPLYGWWSPSLEDNFVTTNPEWAGSKGDTKSPDYRFVRLEGYIKTSRTAHTLPLQSFFNWRNKDRRATTDPRWIGEKGDKRASNTYILERTEGFLVPFFPKWKQPSDSQWWEWAWIWQWWWPLWQVQSITLPVGGKFGDGYPSSYDFSKHNEAEWSCFPFRCEVYRHGLGCGNFSEHQIGYSYSYENGTRPCNCWHYVDCVYRAFAGFELSALQGKKILSAQLRWSDRGACVTNLYVADQKRVDFGLSTSNKILAPFSSNPGPGEIEVGNTVRDWVEGKKANYGWIFGGPDETFPNYLEKDGDFEIGPPNAGTSECVSTIQNLELKVVYTDKD